MFQATSYVVVASMSVLYLLNIFLSIEFIQKLDFLLIFCIKEDLHRSEGLVAFLIRKAAVIGVAKSWRRAYRFHQPAWKHWQMQFSSPAWGWLSQRNLCRNPHERHICRPLEVPGYLHFYKSNHALSLSVQEPSSGQRWVSQWWYCCFPCLLPPITINKFGYLYYTTIFSKSQNSVFIQHLNSCFVLNFFHVWKHFFYSFKSNHRMPWLRIFIMYC